MTTQVQNPVITYTGNNSTTSFSFPFRVIVAADLKVYVDSVLQVAGYNVTGVNTPSGGSAVFTVAPANGAVIRLQRLNVLDREVDYIQGGVIIAETVDEEFDRTVQMIQDLDRVSFKEAADGTLDASTRILSNVGDPINPQDAATKNWTETAGSSFVVLAGNEATNSANSATNSANSAAAALASEQTALVHEDKAQLWAEEAEDVEVETGKFSAKHWSEKAFVNAGGTNFVGKTGDTMTGGLDLRYGGPVILELHDDNPAGNPELIANSVINFRDFYNGNVIKAQIEGGSDGFKLHKSDTFGVLETTLSLSTDGNVSVNGAAPTADDQLTRKDYVDTNFLENQSFITDNTSGSNSGKWTKIATVNLPAQFDGVDTTVNLIGVGHGTTEVRAATLSIRVKQQGTFGNDPIVILAPSVVDNGTVSNNDKYGYVIVQNSGPTIVDLYIQVNQSFVAVAGAQSIKDVFGFIQWSDIQGFSSTVTNLVEVQSTVLGGAGLQTKILDIGDWNMDTTVATNTAHGVADFKKIRSVSVLIRGDVDTFAVGFPAPDGGMTDSETITVNSTNINLKRGAGGYFDNTLFDSTSFNRGWVTIQYVL